MGVKPRTDKSQQITFREYLAMEHVAIFSNGHREGTLREAGMEPEEHYCGEAV